MNTELFDKELRLPKDFNWKDIFSETFKRHTKEQRNEIMVRGVGKENSDYTGMLHQWQKPWVFFRVAVIALFLSFVAYKSINVFPGAGMVTLFFILPAAAIPLAVVMFYWEMNIPGDISLVKTLFLVLIGGIISLGIAGIIINFMSGIIPDVAFIAGPIPEEIAKMTAVLILLYVCKCRFGITGILIGGAVGGGFAIIETSGYALNQLMQYNSVEAVLDLQKLRGQLAPGGHVVWAALYGGALALTMAKNDGKLKLSSMADPLVVMTWTGSVLLHTLWNLGASDMAGVLPDGVVLFWDRIDDYNVKHIILMLVAWAFLLILMRKCIRQIVDYCGSSFQTEAQRTVPAEPSILVDPDRTAGKPEVKPESRKEDQPEQVMLSVRVMSGPNTGQTYKLPAGKKLIFGRDSSSANVVFPPDAKGISRVHCEIKYKDGVPVLVDRGSSFGTYFEDGRQLEPNVLYRLADGTVFCIGSKDNRLMVKVH